MQTNIVQLNKQKHASLKLKQGIDWGNYINENMLPVLIQEMGQLCTELPIVFVKNSQTGQFACVALLGLEARQNLFFKSKQWQGSFIPAVVTHYPLGLIKNPKDETHMLVMIDENSTLTSDSDGDALFDEQGNQSEILNQRIEALQNYYQCGKITQNFIDELLKYALLEEQNLTFDVKGEKKNVAGIYLISEEKLNQLSNNEFLVLKEKNYLKAIYQHLASVNNIRKMIAQINR